MGRYGNGASVMDVARDAGVSEGSVVNFTTRCFTAIESMQTYLEKRWMDEHLGFTGGHWRDGWVMYDGTIIVLYARPDLNGDVYYTRKANYGFNLQMCQVGNVPSNLRIVDYTHGMTGSAHDSAAFAHTAAAKYPDWFFGDGEFAWADSAYAVNSRTIPVHKEPASFRRENKIFDQVVSHIRVRSEHCMGALKGRFQCLRGLRVRIRSAADHTDACRWITVEIVLHNFIIDVEGLEGTSQWMTPHGRQEEFKDRGARHPPLYYEVGDDADAKRRQLVEEIVAIKSME
ncbi:hypothetical protein FA95DRAFT_1584608 [Auriscalpium vulgare]|uniref:Uncharacterized protein n=1 Tax=Auriscalpium vulgare TaxID=40419 RepID=A0ACB8RCL1_9AGAM|nr:hypothetical protein FA95DRAFT_1584608 [Auriscalpium vulgare]